MAQPSLSQDSIGEFRQWLFLDLCSRTGQRGRRQTQPMRGIFSSRTFGKVLDAKQTGRMRGCDFTARLTVWIHSWYLEGFSILEASGRARHVEYVKSRLGKSKRGRRCRWCTEGTEIDETARTSYYAFKKHHPNLNMLFNGWFSSYLSWRQWVVSTSEESLKFAAGLYAKNGLPEQGKRFLAFADRIRRNAGTRTAR
jgi:hypothetical protein